MASVSVVGDSARMRSNMRRTTTLVLEPPASFPVVWAIARPAGVPPMLPRPPQGRVEHGIAKQQPGVGGGEENGDRQPEPEHQPKCLQRHVARDPGGKGPATRLDRVPQNSVTVRPSGTGRSIASSVIAIATTASEKKVSRSAARASVSTSSSGTGRLSPAVSARDQWMPRCPPASRYSTLPCSRSASGSSSSSTAQAARRRWAAAEGVLRRVLAPYLLLGEAAFGGHRGRDPVQPGRIGGSRAERVGGHPARPVQQADLAHQVEHCRVDHARTGLVRPRLKPERAGERHEPRPRHSRSRTACSSRSSPPTLMLHPAASASGSMLSADPRTGSPAANTAIRTGPVSPGLASAAAISSIASLPPMSAAHAVTSSQSAASAFKSSTPRATASTDTRAGSAARQRPAR